MLEISPSLVFQGEWGACEFILADQTLGRIRGAISLGRMPRNTDEEGKVPVGLSCVSPGPTTVTGKAAWSVLGRERGETRTAQFAPNTDLSSQEP